MTKSMLKKYSNARTVQPRMKKSIALKNTNLGSLLSTLHMKIRFRREEASPFPFPVMIVVDFFWGGGGRSKKNQNTLI